MYVTVTGIFDSLAVAEKAKSALIAMGVPEPRIELRPAGNGYTMGVRAESSLERERIRELLLRNGASSVRKEAL
jgi:hypothetical protein